MKYYKKLNDSRSRVETLINSVVNRINTNLLVKVVAANASSETITVEILSYRSYLDEFNDRQYEQLSNQEVRLAYQKGFASVTKPGDFGMLIVMQSDIEVFLSNKNNNPRKYDLADGIFIPMQYGNVNSENLIISSDSGEDINISSGKNINLTGTNVVSNVTKFSVKNNTDDLIALLQDLASVASSIVVNTTTGALEPGIASQLSAIASKIGAFVE